MAPNIGAYSKKSFLKKLQDSSVNDTIELRGMDESKQELLDSIKLNLEFLLNARRGSAPCAPSLGLEDFNDSNFTAQDLFLRITQDIKRNIETYEPRVHVIEISSSHNAENPLDLNFKLSCQIKSEHNVINEDIDLYMNGITKKLYLK